MTEDEKEHSYTQKNDVKEDVKEKNKKERAQKKEISKNKKDSLKDENLLEEKNALIEEINRIKSENEAIKKKLEEEHNNMLRIAADYENLKKRLYKDMENRLKFANSELIKELLPVMDHLEMALTHAKDSSNTDALYEGVNLTLKQLKNVLEKFGLEDIKIGDNENFDPSFHEAMMLDNYEDKDNNVITKILQKGYLMHGNVIRPAKVAVNKKVNHKKEEENGK